MEKQKQQAYVRLETDDAVNAKRDVLSMQMNLLQIITKIGAYKKQRKQETRDRIELRKRIKDIKSGLKEFVEKLPEVEKPRIKFHKTSSAAKVVKQREIKEKETNLKKTIDQQLAEIKARLQKLDNG